MIVVSDSSVITSLIQVGHYELLRQLNGAVLIPRAVQVADLEVELDLGEAEAIVLAKETNADLLLIDEKLGRQVALR